MTHDTSHGESGRRHRTSLLALAPLPLVVSPVLGQDVLGLGASWQSPGPLLVLGLALLLGPPVLLTLGGLVAFARGLPPAWMPWVGFGGANIGIASLVFGLAVVVTFTPAPEWLAGLGALSVLASWIGIPALVSAWRGADHAAALGMSLAGGLAVLACMGSGPAPAGSFYATGLASLTALALGAACWCFQRREGWLRVLAWLSGAGISSSAVWAAKALELHHGLVTGSGLNWGDYLMMAGALQLLPLLLVPVAQGARWSVRRWERFAAPD